MEVAKSANSEYFYASSEKLSLFLEYFGTWDFKSTYEAQCTLHPSPLLPANFGNEELVVAFDCIQYESEHIFFMTELFLDTIQSCLNITLPLNVTMPGNDEDELEALAITIHPEVFHYFYDPLCFGVNKAQAPSWFKHVVELLKKATLYKEWMHTLNRVDITLATELDKPEVFHLYTDELPKMFGINLKVSAKKRDELTQTDDEENDNTSESSEDGSDNDNSYDS